MHNVRLLPQSYIQFPARAALKNNLQLVDQTRQKCLCQCSLAEVKCVRPKDLDINKTVLMKVVLLDELCKIVPVDVVLLGELSKTVTLILD